MSPQGRKTTHRTNLFINSKRIITFSLDLSQIFAKEIASGSLIKRYCYVCKEVMQDASAKSFIKRQADRSKVCITIVVKNKQKVRRMANRID